MRESLRAGIAIYNEGYYHAAHDPWEDEWLELDAGTDDEQFLHGLIQCTAAVYHATNSNWEGATGLANSARSYLSGLSDTYRNVALDPIRAFLSRLASDPTLLERESPVRIEHEDSVIEFDDLGPESTMIAAVVLADELGYDGDTITSARAFARADLAAGKEDSLFLASLFEFVRTPAHRDLVCQRLKAHVEQRTAREEDVAGLF